MVDRRDSCRLMKGQGLYPVAKLMTLSSGKREWIHSMLTVSVFKNIVFFNGNVYKLDLAKNADKKLPLH